MTAMIKVHVRSAAEALRDAIAAPSEQRSVRVEGAEVRYRYWKGPASGGARPVLLVHGMFAHARWWDGVAGWLQADRAVAALDLSGMGDSDWRPHYGREQHAREIIAVTRDLALERPFLVAHSYGGDPAVRSALLEPDLFHSLVLVDSRLLMKGIHDYSLVRNPDLSVRKTYSGLDEALARFRLLPATVHPDPVMFDHIARHSLVDIGDGWAWKFDKRLSMGAERAGTLDPSGLALSVTFIRGEESDVTTAHQMAVTRRELSQARFLSIPGAGHHVMVDQPLALTAMLRGILVEPGSA